MREAVEGISAPVRRPWRLLPEAQRVVCGALPVVREIEIVGAGGLAAPTSGPLATMVFRKTAIETVPDG